MSRCCLSASPSLLFPNCSAFLSILPTVCDLDWDLDFVFSYSGGHNDETHSDIQLNIVGFFPSIEAYSNVLMQDSFPTVKMDSCFHLD